MVKYPDLKALHIVHYPSPRLREKAVELREINSFLGEMKLRMAELLKEAEGIGLASTQVGWPFRFVILTANIESGEVEAFINPVIIEKDGRQVGDEGCLSVPGVFAKVRRAERVRVRATLLSGEKVELEGEGLLARAWQHELDHLDGGLFVDRLWPAARIMVRSQLHDLERRYEAEHAGKEESASGAACDGEDPPEAVG